MGRENGLEVNWFSLSKVHLICVYKTKGLPIQTISVQAAFRHMV